MRCKSTERQPSHITTPVLLQENQNEVVMKLGCEKSTQNKLINKIKSQDWMTFIEMSFLMLLQVCLLLHLQTGNALAENKAGQR